MTTERKKRRGYVKLHRSLMELVHDEGLFALYGYLLMRASYKRRTLQTSIGRASKPVQLEPGQVVFGSKSAARFLRKSPSTIRDRLSALHRLGYIVTHPATHFTIVTVCNFGLSEQSTNDNRHPSRHPSPENSVTHSATHLRYIQEGINTRKVSTRTSSKLRFDEADMQLARHIWERVETLAAGQKPPKLEAWANLIRLTRENDHRTIEDLGATFDAAHGDPFWRTNICSPAKLREKFDTLRIKLFHGASTVHSGKSEAAAGNSAARPRTGEYANITGIRSSRPSLASEGVG